MPEGTTTSAAPAGFGRRLSARVIDILVTWYGITLGALVILAGMLAPPARNRPAHVTQPPTGPR